MLEQLYAIVEKRSTAGGEDVPYAAIAELVQDNWLRYKTAKTEGREHPLFTNKQIATAFNRLKGNLSRALERYLPPALVNERRLELRRRHAYDQFINIPSATQSRHGVAGYEASIGRWSRSKRKRNLQRARVLKSAGITISGERYDSVQEAVCGFLMQKYIPTFTLEAGVSHQVPVSGKHIDFRVNHRWPATFVEYHPIILGFPHGEFDSPDAFEEYKERLNKVPVEQQEDYRKQVSGALAERYRQSRLESIAESDHKGTPLVVVHNPYDLHTFLVRFGDSRLPHKEDFRMDFDGLVKRVRAARKNGAFVQRV